MCSSRKYPYSPHRRDWNFLGDGGGGGSGRSKKYKEMYEALPEFPEGWEGVRKKSLLWGRYGYFLELHNGKLQQKLFKNAGRLCTNFLPRGGHNGTYFLKDRPWIKKGTIEETGFAKEHRSCVLQASVIECESIPQSRPLINTPLILDGHSL